MDGLGIKVKERKVVHFTISKRKKEKKKVDEFLKLLVSEMRKKANVKSEMNYSKIYANQVGFLKPLIILGAIVFLFSSVFFYIKGIKPPISFYFMPGLLIFMYIKAYK